MSALSSAKNGLLSVSAATLALCLTACASDPHSDGPEIAGAANATTEAEDVNSRCNESDNLLTNTDFATAGDWIYTQHAGEKSFGVRIDQGVLKIVRIGPEPWMVYRQRVPLSSTPAQRLRFSAELKGEILFTPPDHTWEHVAGLYLQLRPSAYASVAEHLPNQGVWEWQEVAIEIDVPIYTTHAFVGFTHQGGGTLWARNPSLVLLDCQEPN